MIDNLSQNIFDLVEEAEITDFRSSQDAFTNQSEDLRYGIDYDIIVESFYCEYKLDVKALKSIQEQYILSINPVEKQQLQNEFYELYPESISEPNIAKVNIPDTILKKAYFVQSPKGRDGLPAIHYSLKEKMLSDLRATRAKVKKDMKQAALAHDAVAENRYNAKQLAIKVVCNSEYGAANNEYFAHYDPDVASAVTRGARRLINFLTNNLETDDLFVDQKFLNDFAPQIKNLSDIGCVHVEPLTDQSQLLTNRRHCIRRLFDDSYNIIQPNVFRINLKPSVVCYQDTDSNYYKNDYIADYYTMQGGNFICSPELIDKCMHSMLAHNELLGGFIKYSIGRRPYELGFEGAFIVCRYLNRKKKYYGIKWGDDAELRLTARIDDDNAYDENGDLVEDFMPYWKPKQTVIPQPNGDYIFIDADKLLHQGVNYLDYVRGQDVKCTGVDLARRDQYKFINFFHIVVLQKDLRVMKYNGHGKWETYSKDEPMEYIVNDVIETFHQIILQYQRIANLQSSELPKYDFNILDFAKNSAYRFGKQNTVSQIVKRLQKEGKEQYIPGIGERMTFITILDDNTKQWRAEGKAKQTNTGERSYVVQEILDRLYADYPEAEFEEKKAHIPEISDLTYETYINAQAICLLDIKWYLEYLCKSMALYIVADKFPDEIQRIDDGLISPKDAGALISKLQEKISKEYVDKYFPRSKEYTKHIKAQEKLKLNITVNRHELVKRYPDIDFDNLDKTKFNQVMADLNQTKENYDTLLKMHQQVYQSLSTNKFFSHVFKNPLKNEIVSKYKDDIPGLEKTISDIINRLNNVRGCIVALKTVIKVKNNSSDDEQEEEDY